MPIRHTQKSWLESYYPLNPAMYDDMHYSLNLLLNRNIAALFLHGTCKLYIHTMNIHTLHYITLHYITLHYVTLRYVTLHYITLHTYIVYLVGGFNPSEKYESQLDCLFPIYIYIWTNKNVPNHQPGIFTMVNL